MTKPLQEARPGERSIDRLLRIVETLRGENGCPWDREQTLESLKPGLIEECYEVLDAVDSNDADSHAEELGDVLLHIALHARIREEKGDFNFEDVARRLSDKLVRRHPHVFADVQAGDVEKVLRNWEAIKATEKKDQTRSVLEGIPRHMPALQKAQRIQERAARVGFDWSRADQVMDKIEEELAETKSALDKKDEASLREELGDLLFAVVNLCRFRGLNAEEVLAGTCRKFTRRFQEVERRVEASGKKMQECPIEGLEDHWTAVKKEESAVR